MGEVHVHYYYDGIDCDGRLERAGVMVEDENATMESVLEQLVTEQYHVYEGDMDEHGGPVWARIGHYDDEYEHQRELVIEPIMDTRENGRDEDGRIRFEVYLFGWRVTTSAPHEEGGRMERYEICEDPRCDVHEPSVQRDHSAEAMGY